MTASQRIRQEREERIALGVANLVATGKCLYWPEAVSYSARLLGVTPAAVAHCVMATRHRFAEQFNGYDNAEVARWI